VAGTGKGATPRQRELGRRIQERRTALGLSQEGLAHRSGIHRTYVGSLESGERNPSVDNVVRLAVALNQDPGDLVKGLHKFEGRSKPE
jgi:transcriptional regulator with XRE-family HTH domain